MKFHRHQKAKKEILSNLCNLASSNECKKFLLKNKRFYCSSTFASVSSSTSMFVILATKCRVQATLKWEFVSGHKSFVAVVACCLLLAWPRSKSFQVSTVWEKKIMKFYYLSISQSIYLTIYLSLLYLYLSIYHSP